MLMKTAQPIKWHGGKSYLAKWILEHFPSRDSYTHYNEPFAGGLSVLFAHDPEGKSETVNDLNFGLTNFWQVLQAGKWFRHFERLVSVTPLSQVEFEYSSKVDFESEEDHPEVVKAFDFFVKYRQSRQGLGKDYATPTRRTRRGMNENVSSWLSAVDGLPEAHERLRRVEIRNMEATAFIRKYDHEKALFYIDPPYLHETRVTTGDYEYEMSEEDHNELLKCLAFIKGKFILSGYPSTLYRMWSASQSFRCVEKQIDNKASSKKTKEKKTECLWMNY